ncbi:DUF7606 domain-containing protein [Gallibacterium genomosp. 1]|uniref:ACP-like domain-containing protein n=1 Tax=Gallibacterium genomosp. 1 TaxID=155515 RepID=A0AB36DWW8_9PAST|nr:hypothetical protein [Gallibacterium genomosp. 1]OBX01739.1 hypothetical protein QV05_04730 [Gallibacterium genomosp. 1]OBX02659.1 hypothetical protein QV04_03495 [Gallibacterium genomosp. 1]
MKLKLVTVLFVLGLAQACSVNAEQSTNNSNDGAAVNTNDFSVQFAKGENFAELKGTIKGYDVDRYSFYAKQGQLLTLETIDNDRQIQFSLNHAKATANLSAIYQVLPYSGKYTLTVYQTRNDARKQPNVKRVYNVKLKIINVEQKNIKGINDIVYRCDNGKDLKISYQQDQVNVFWQGKMELLKWDKQLSQGDHFVFANQYYMLSVEALNTQNWQQSKVNSWLQLGKTASQDKVLLQECVAK